MSRRRAVTPCERGGCSNEGKRRHLHGFEMTLCATHYTATAEEFGRLQRSLF